MSFDNGAVSAAMTLIEDSVFLPETFAASLEAAGRVLGFDHFCMVHAELDKPTFIASPSSLEALNAYAAGGWLEVDYRAAYIERFEVGKLFLDNIEVPKEVRAPSVIYNELYRPYAMSYYAGWKFNVAGSTWIHSLARSENRGPTSPGEADGLRWLAPFANRAALVARELRETRVHGMVDGLAAAGLSAILIDQDGRVGLATPGSERLFDDTFGMKQRTLWAADLQAQASLNLLSQIARGRASTDLIPNVVIRRRDGRRPILIQTVPVRGVGLDVLPGARLLAILIDLDGDGSASNQQLRQLFGLSPAEAQVAALLAEGSSVAEIAIARGVEEITVRGQLKALYRKLDASRQSDVVRLVERLRPTMGHTPRQP